MSLLAAYGTKSKSIMRYERNNIVYLLVAVQWYIPKSWSALSKNREPLGRTSLCAVFPIFTGWLSLYHTIWTFSPETLQRRVAGSFLTTRTSRGCSFITGASPKSIVVLLVLTGSASVSVYNSNSSDTFVDFMFCKVRCSIWIFNQTAIGHW